MATTADPPGGMNERRDMALALARRHLAVFRVRCRDKRPVATGWQQEATSEPAVITKLFAVDHNIGIATGEPSRCFALDIDGEEGETSIFALEEAHVVRLVSNLVDGDATHHYVDLDLRDVDRRLKFPGVDGSVKAPFFTPSAGAQTAGVPA